MDEAGAEASPPADASSPVPKAQRPRLRKLTIRNLRCIGPEPVNIELDDIVVLVGPNNAGKSTILFAYELAMNQGSKKERLALSDFPNGKVDLENLPQIELETVIHGTEMPAAKWVQVEENGDHVVRERWTWERHDASPRRAGFNIETKSWDEGVPQPPADNVSTQKSSVAPVDSSAQANMFGVLFSGIHNQKQS